MNHREGTRKSLRTVGIFAGIGGIEAGLRRQKHSTVLLAEIEPFAQSVLRKNFPSAQIVGDVRGLSKLPDCDLIAAGFPCQDLSQCGRTNGIRGRHSSLVGEVFRLIEGADRRPDWVLLENVPFMLQLDSGRALTFITGELEKLGYRWAYRTVNAMAFGIPQRRLRVMLVAARDGEPERVLFSDDSPEPAKPGAPEVYGFYWTEGNAGLGWAPDGVPTLKGGSTIGIPSPPAIWIPATRELVTIDIRDAERLQGFPANWTRSPEIVAQGERVRWKLVGNAVSIPVAAWVGKRLASPGEMVCQFGVKLEAGTKRPSAASGGPEGAWEVLASTWPVTKPMEPLLKFLKFPTRPLSARATAGFLSRALKSNLRFEKGFLADVEHYLDTVAVGRFEKFKLSARRV